VTDHAAAVEAVRAHHYEISFDFERICYECRQEWPCETIGLLRAYEAVVADNGRLNNRIQGAEMFGVSMLEQRYEQTLMLLRQEQERVASLRAQHAALVAVLDAALAWEGAANNMEALELVTVLERAIRAYRAAKERT
jgi:hypothetical protein